jgi:hypothetical protein
MGYMVFIVVIGAGVIQRQQKPKASPQRAPRNTKIHKEQQESK